MTEEAKNIGVDSCPQCGSKLEPYKDKGAQCTSSDCGWVITENYSGKPLDLSWRTGPWDKPGETVDATPKEDNGKVITTDWPDAAQGQPEDYSEKQELIIRAVARYPDKTAPQLADLLDFNHDTYIRKTISEHWPEREEQIKVGVNEKAIPDSDIEDIRRSVLNGVPLGHIAEEYGSSQNAVRARIRGDAGDDSGSSIPPLEYNNENQSYELPEGYENGEFQCEYCGKSFDTQSSMYGHQGNCAERKREDEGTTEDEIQNDLSQVDEKQEAAVEVDEEAEDSMERQTVRISPQHQSQLDEKVAEGIYSSKSEAIREGIRCVLEEDAIKETSGLNRVRDVAETLRNSATDQLEVEESAHARGRKSAAESILRVLKSQGEWQADGRTNQKPTEKIDD